MSQLRHPVAGQGPADRGPGHAQAVVTSQDVSMARRNAPLNVEGRCRMVTLVIDHSRFQCRVAERFQGSPAAVPTTVQAAWASRGSSRIRIDVARHLPHWPLEIAHTRRRILTAS